MDKSITIIQSSSEKSPTKKGNEVNEHGVMLKRER
jgi:hypothetical protein